MNTQGFHLTYQLPQVGLLNQHGCVCFLRQTEKLFPTEFSRWPHQQDRNFLFGLVRAFSLRRKTPSRHVPHEQEYCAITSLQPRICLDRTNCVVITPDAPGEERCCSSGVINRICTALTLEGKTSVHDAGSITRLRKNNKAPFGQEEGAATPPSRTRGGQYLAEVVDIDVSPGQVRDPAQVLYVERVHLLDVLLSQLHACNISFAQLTAAKLSRACRLYQAKNRIAVNKFSTRDCGQHQFRE